jgi:hypothetical protein
MNGRSRANDDDLFRATSRGLRDRASVPPPHFAERGRDPRRGNAVARRGIVFGELRWTGGERETSAVERERGAEGGRDARRGSEEDGSDLRPAPIDRPRSSHTGSHTTAFAW